MMSGRARSRLHFLDYLDDLISKPETPEKIVHCALERNLWVLGSKYASWPQTAPSALVSATFNQTYVGNEQMSGRISCSRKMPVSATC